MNKKLLIIGKIPPPIGGVTIHVNRLINHLKYEQINFQFLDLSKFKAFEFVKAIKDCKVIHCHSNNRHFLLFCALYTKFFKSKLIITIHGNTYSKGWIHSISEKFAIKYAYIPIVLNKGSYNYAKRLNSRTEIISSFIPPIEKETILPEHILEQVEILQKSTIKLFCSNASSFALDCNKQEIYGINNLIEIFKNITEYGLIISDPSYEYAKKNKLLPANIIIISEPHSFSGILLNCDAFIRATTTDGDSISIKEALFYKKDVIATDCVSRPRGTLTYKTGDWEMLYTIIKKIPIEKEIPVRSPTNGFIELLNIYKVLM